MPIDTSWMQAALNQPQMPDRNALALQNLQIQKAQMEMQDLIKKREGLAQLRAALPPGADAKQIFQTTMQHAAANGDMETARKAHEAYQQIVDAEETSKLASQFESRFLGAGAPADVPMAGAPMAAPTNALAPAGAAPTSINAMQGGVPQEELGLLARMATVDPKRAAAYADLLKMKYPNTSQIAARPVTVMQNGKPMVVDAVTGRIIGEAPPSRAVAAPEADQGIDVSPGGLDLMAQTYIQGGGLPTGMGAKMSEMRGKIINRAAELIGKPAAEAAAGVVSAKQTRAAEQRTLTNFASGVEGRRVAANNTAINHLETMEKLVADLANDDARVVNRAATLFAKETGAPAPTSFDAAKQIVAAEVIKAVVQNGGGVTERQEAAEQFSRANSPEQLAQVIETYKDLLGGQLQSLKMQYSSGTGRDDFDKKLLPNTKKILQRLEPVTPSNNIDAAAPAPAPSNTRTTKGGVTYTVEED